MLNRRELLMGTAASAALAAWPSFAAAKPSEIRAILLHLGLNEWGDWLGPDEERDQGRNYTADKIRFDETIWRETVDYMRKAGMNTVVMDLGEFVAYPSHPELGVTGSWTAERMNAEVRRVKAMGLEPIPKLNFSAGHDSWLKEYHRMVSTRQYYKVCADVIKDVCDIFEKPRFIHLGYDEETAGHQHKQTHVTVRQGELWWHDFLWFCRGVGKLGMRPWIWSDYGWKHDDFVGRCPKEVLHSNWYYDEQMGGFDPDTTTNAWSKSVLRLYEALDKAGFEQVPCASNWQSPQRKKAGLANNDACMGELVKFCRERLSPANLKGFMMASWTNCAGRGCQTFNHAGIDQLATALRDFPPRG